MARKEVCFHLKDVEDFVLNTQASKATLTSQTWYNSSSTGRVQTLKTGTHLEWKLCCGENPNMMENTILAWCPSKMSRRQCRRLSARTATEYSPSEGRRKTEFQFVSHLKSKFTQNSAINPHKEVLLTDASRLAAVCKSCFHGNKARRWARPTTGKVLMS